MCPQGPTSLGSRACASPYLGPAATCSRALLAAIEETTALWRAAVAGNFLAICRKAVIESEFLTGADVSPAEEEDVAASSTRQKIRLTAMIDEFRTAPACGCVDVPVPANAEEIDGLSSTRRPKLLHAFQSFSPCNPLACIFDHFLTRRNRFLREHTEAVNRRATDPQTKTRSPRVNEAEHPSAKVGLPARRRTKQGCHQEGDSPRCRW